MKKKFLTFILSICFIIPCMFMLSACNTTPAKTEFKVENGYIQYYDGENWNNLIAVEELEGEDGVGQNGKKVELDVSATHILWKYEGDVQWQELISLDLIRGQEGKKIDLRVSNGYLQWQYVGDENWTDLIKLIPDVENVTITFDTNGADINIPSQTIEKGTKIARPETPVRDGYEFLGWEYDDQGAKDLWSFTGYTIDKDITLTAKWKEDFYTEGLQFGWVNEERDSANGFDNYDNSESRTLEVVRYYGDAKDVVIPRTYKNVTVSGIWFRAFQNDTNITSVNLPNTIKIIDSEVFENCSSLSIISLPESIEVIGDEAFKGCSSLEEIVVPKSVNSLGNAVFSGCSTLRSVVLDMKVNTIPTYTFRDCAKLKNIDFNSSLEIIGNYAFYNTDGLVNLDLPNSIREIGTISGCDLLESIRIPNTCLKVNGITGCPKLVYTEDKGGSYLGNEDNKYHIFMDISSNDNLPLEINENCKVIQYGALAETIKETINIPASVIQLGYNNRLNVGGGRITNFVVNESNPMFASEDGLLYNKDKTVLIHCPKQKSDIINISQNTKTIGEEAFEYCYNVTEVILPESLLEICENAFYACSKLTSVSIPKNVEKISPRAFDGRYLTSIVIDEENNVYDSRNNCNAIIETATNTLIFACNVSKIPNNITCIGEDSFANCELTSIILPASITRIENYGYTTYGSALKTLYYYGNVSQWENVEIIDDTSYNAFDTNVDVYYYVSNEQELPNDGGNYWHYDTDGITPIAW